MSADEFWHGDLRLCKAYRDANKTRREIEDVRQWKAGIYTFQALVAASGAYRELSPGPDATYPEAPLFGSQETRERAERMKEKRKLEKDKAFVETFAAQFNAKFEAESESKEQ